MSIEIKGRLMNCKDNCLREPKSFCVAYGKDRLFFRPAENPLPERSKYRPGIELRGSVNECPDRKDVAS